MTAIAANPVSTETEAACASTLIQCDCGVRGGHTHMTDICFSLCFTTTTRPVIAATVTAGLKQDEEQLDLTETAAESY